MLNLVCDLKKLQQNATSVQNWCHKAKIDPIFVSKCINSNPEVLKALKGFDWVADSNIENLKRIRKLRMRKMLLRSPSKDELKDCLKYADSSLQSELSTIFALEAEAKKQGRRHEFLIAVDLGDLREGFFYKKELLAAGKKLKELKSLRIRGVAANFSCFGAILPSPKNLARLCDLAKKLEEILDYKLDVISGGNSSSLELLKRGQVPSAINQLRIGAAVLCGDNPYMDSYFHDLHQDECFYLEARVIELKDKPSIPIGEQGVDAFGKKPVFKDNGVVKRAILNVGKASLELDAIHIKSKGIEILGASSDHLLLDVSRYKKPLEIGSKIKIYLGYRALLRASNSSYVKLKIK